MLVHFGRSLCVALVLVLVQSARAQAELRIEWHVENAFRFFLDAADTHIHRAVWTSLSEADRRRPVQTAERVLGERHPDGWAAMMFSSTCWDPGLNRYSCRAKSDYLSPKSHAVLARLEGLEDAQSVDCVWLTSPQGRGPRGKVVTLPCDTPVQLEVPYP